MPSEQLRSHSPSLDDVTQIHGRAGNLDNLDNLVCVFAAPLSQPFLLPGDLTNASAALLTPVCLKHFSSFGFPCHHLLLLLPPVLFHAVHCTNFLICSVGNISSCSLFCSSVGKKHGGNHWQWKFGLSRCVLGRKQQFLSAQ